MRISYSGLMTMNTSKDSNQIFLDLTFYTVAVGFWWIQAINDAGGWKGQITVEDMELALRASLKSWKFVFVANSGELSNKHIVWPPNFFCLK